MCVGGTLPQVHMNLKASTCMHTWYKASQHFSVFVILYKSLSGHCHDAICDPLYSRGFDTRLNVIFSNFFSSDILKV